MTPASIKKGITGSGGARKKEMIRMVERLLDLKGIGDDTADALAAAFAGLSILSSSAFRGGVAG
jgi:Holliday junction resolvasome RuvABC endonuclease subunit